MKLVLTGKLNNNAVLRTNDGFRGAASQHACTYPRSA